MNTVFGIAWIALGVLTIACWLLALRRHRLIGENECPERIADALDVLIKNAIDRVSTKGELKQERSRHAQQEQLQ